ncbi:hypothetical protein CCR75_006256 [Bremia lactucae]|uniref:Uncharacterized protein n=1 Tax=Bremia lactucae TaxID=4779 RepID=A0A976FNB5_BRELC|nr:hypothetical protein CCR75_006256 [Bremia lactucae]
MVYAPSLSLVSAAVAVVILKVQETSAGSMYYGSFTVANTTDVISPSFPGYGADVADDDCAFEVTIDSTLPDLTTIPSVVAPFPELLCNSSVVPTEPISNKVGTYARGVTSPNDCATGWQKPSLAPTVQLNRNLKASSIVDQSLKRKRRLEGLNTPDVARLEAHFGATIVTNLESLPLGNIFSKTVWPAPYWPSYQDSINIAWKKGEASPAEKYATAFNLNVTEFMDNVSAKNGVDSRNQSPICTTNSDCVSDISEKIPKACGIRSGKNSGYCIPKWYGVCHAWAAAAISENEPKCAVTHNNVTFHPLDIKGLITNIYDGVGVKSVFTGIRYRGGNDVKDNFGRQSSPEFRDLNPGYFHIAATNILGVLNSTFIVDVSAQRDVWNHPVRSFQVDEKTPMSLEVAAQTFYGLAKYPWNEAASSIVYIKSRLVWVIDTYDDGGLSSPDAINRYTKFTDLTYLLELDDLGDIIGGEWLYNSTSNHPDFLWLVESKPDPNAVTSFGLRNADVSILMEKSVAC